MSLLAGCLVGIWFLVLTALNAVLPADPAVLQIRSALFPAGTVMILVWIFASLHATFYGLIRERFAAQLGLTRADYEVVDARREVARAKAEKALGRARNLGKSR